MSPSFCGSNARLPRLPRLPGLPALLVAAVLAGCGSGEPAGPPAPASLIVVSGQNQEGIAGGPLSLPVIIQVRSQQGPLAGASVGFAVGTGGGRVNRSSAQTDAAGHASVSWTLGPLVGAQTLQVTVGTLPPQVVHATGQVGPPSLLIPVVGNSQFAVVGAPVPISPRVRLTDAFGNPLPGELVQFMVLEGGGHIDGTSPTTNAAGEAELGGWTLGPAAGTNRIRAFTGGGISTEFIAFGTPAMVVTFAGDAQEANVGTATPVLPAVQALDGQGQPLAGVLVSFAVESGGGSVVGTSQTTDAAGVARVGAWILGPAPGENAIAATVFGLPATRFRATGVPGIAAGIAAAGGDGLTGFVGNFLSAAPTVRVTDAQGNPVAAQAVTFSLVSGGGSLAGEVRQTDFDGRASLGSWRLGPGPGSQSVQAQAAGLAPVFFTATASDPPAPGFTITLRFTATPTPSQEAAFLNAAALWERIVLGDLPDVLVQWPQGGCVPVALDETVDDVLIFAEVVAIDGPGGILGSAGPCLIRTASSLPVVGRMRFDSADLVTLEDLGVLETVIVHEMAHVLGFGTIWSLLDLLQGVGSGNPFFSGLSARSAFSWISAPTGFPGTAVPVENTGGQGTANSHWRETVFGNELMTGFLNQGANPLSAVTAASLRDMGYVVDDTRSELYTLPAFLRALEPPVLELREAPLPWPIYGISRTGRVERVFFR